VQAYAFFLYHSQRLKDDAKKRLRAIVEASELGSGFQIAMRDLEIRGAGEILGASQSGNMQTVGVSHYLRMLKSAVEELKRGGTSDEEEIGATTEIILPFEALLPSFYVTDEQEKIAVYQKLAGSEDEAMLKEFENDLIQEFGPIPKQAEHLLNVLRLKMACRRAGVVRIKMDTVSSTKRDIVVSLSPRVTATEIMQLLADTPQWRISGATIRIADVEMEKSAGNAEWLTEITRQIALLEKRKVKSHKSKVTSA
jgi:transcription-repair coupling factor (superfamily II helicase)